MKNLFITGIGTNVGKTIVSAIFTESYKADYWKPIQSGTDEGKDGDTIKQLISNTVTKIFSESYLLKAPLSPNIAAKQEGIKIDLDNIVLPKKINEVENKYLIIEGAGGLLVPINNQHFVIDIAKKFNCEIVLVINEYLGCINHALLSINYLQQHQYKIHVIVFNGSFNTEVKQSILNFCKGIKTIDIPQIEPLTKESILQNTISYLEFK